MPFPALIAPILMSAAAMEDPPIIVTGYLWAPFISPMGEPFRGGANRVAPIARWFGGVDRNRDGAVTEEELQADADQFFLRLDTNRDGQIDPQEITTYEWQIAPDIQVNSNWKRPRGQLAPASKDSASRKDRRGKRNGDEYDGYHIDGLQGAARYGLLNIPQPVASADTDFNRAVTRAEFRQAASYRFKLLDSRGQGRLSLQELEARVPTRPEGKRHKPDKDSKDSRIGLPLPEGD